MTGLWIGLSISVAQAEIKMLLERWFPDLAVWSRDQALAASGQTWAPIVFWLDHRASVSDFPTVVHFDRFPGADAQAVQVGISLAKRLGDALRCKSITDGSGLGDDDSPYWSIVWDDGSPFLADDSHSLFADDDGGDVRIVRQVELTAHELSREGKLIEPSKR